MEDSITGTGFPFGEKNVPKLDCSGDYSIL